MSMCAGARPAPPAHVGVHNFQRRVALRTIAGLEQARVAPASACRLAAG
jgi:hypothetical protein